MTEQMTTPVPVAVEHMDGSLLASLASIAYNMGMRQAALAYIDRAYAAFDLACSNLSAPAAEDWSRSEASFSA
jgi:hypothetical protein